MSGDDVVGLVRRICEEHDIRCREPRVLHRGSSVIVVVAPDGPVARVAGLTAAVRDVEAHYQRDVELARWLSEQGAPVVAPWSTPGPFVREGQVVTLWCLARDGPPASGEAAGVALRRCHRALADYPGELPPVNSLLGEAAEILPRVALAADDRALIEASLSGVSQRISTLRLPVQPIHGDAGMGNVLAGGLWHDWEDCCRGPVAWDLACVVSTARIVGRNRERAEAALASYGDVPDRDAFDLFVASRGLQVLTWSLLTSQQQGQHRQSTSERLTWLHQEFE